MAANTMATIEPRLMHLLNVNDSKDHLPPIQSRPDDPVSPKDAAFHPLPPLPFPSPGSTAPAPVVGGKQEQHQLQQQSNQVATAAPGSAFGQTVGDEESTVAGGFGGSGWPMRSLRMVLGETANNAADAAIFSGGLDDPAMAVMSASSIGKRPRILPHTEELMQLPQPLKKQKSSQQVGSLSQAFPPIINGLHEPPPNAAVFPPIASVEFDADDVLSRGPLAADFANNANSAAAGARGEKGRKGKGISRSGGGDLLGGTRSPSSTRPDRISVTSTSSTVALPPTGPGTVLPVSAFVSPPTSEKDFRTSSAPAKSRTRETSETAETPSPSASGPAVTKSKRRATKPRRRWTEDETNQLLIGVSRHGLGKWTSILEDPEFSFSNRTAGDLKDRFRTCCPDELRGKLNQREPPATTGYDASSPPATTTNRLKTKTSLSLEDLLIESDEQADQHGQAQDTAGAAAGPSRPAKLRKRRVHRRNMEDMVKLGIQGPFKRSHRRERRPFTEQDDKEILEGLQIYGPAWTKIHRHAGFNLSSRQPTDLRDRVRNKYPEIYASIEKGAFQPQQDTARKTLSPTTTGNHDHPGSDGGLTKGGVNASSKPSVNTTSEKSTAASNALDTSFSHPPSTSSVHQPAPSLHQANSGEQLSRRPNLPSSSIRAEHMDSHDPSIFDLGESSTSSFLNNVGEMDISRLLLEDPHIPPYSL